MGEPEAARRNVLAAFAAVRARPAPGVFDWREKLIYRGKYREEREV
jgi:hypothetical protein